MRAARARVCVECVCVCVHQPLMEALMLLMGVLLSICNSLMLEVVWCELHWCRANLLGRGHIIVQSIPASTYLHGNTTVSWKLLLVHKDGCPVTDVVLRTKRYYCEKW